MTDLQRKIGQTGDLVAEGRDMGTVVFPNAEHKIIKNAGHNTHLEYPDKFARTVNELLKKVHKVLKS